MPVRAIYTSILRAWACLSVVLVVTIAPAAAEQPTGPALKHGPAFNKALDENLEIQWGGSLSLRAALAGLSRSQGVAILLDRRIDPGQSVELTLASTTLSDALKQIAAKLNLGTTQIGPVIYFGPPASAARLRTLAAIGRQQAQSAATARRGALLRPATMQWDDLATPRELLAQVAKEAGLTIDNIELVPHDLWAGQELPPLAPIDRLTLLATEFDLRPAINREGTSVELQAIAEPVRFERVFQVGANARQVADKLRQAIPDATIDVRGQKLAVLGRAEDHDVVEGALQGKPFQVTKSTKSTAAEGAKVFTLRVDNQPIGPLLKQLAVKLQLDLQMDSAAVQAAGVKLDTLVSFAVEKATLEDLLKAAVAPAKLTYRIEGKNLIVTPQAK